MHLRESMSEHSPGKVHGKCDHQEFFPFATEKILHFLGMHVVAPCLEAVWQFARFSHRAEQQDAKAHQMKETQRGCNLNVLARPCLSWVLGWGRGLRLRSHSPILEGWKANWRSFFESSRGLPGYNPPEDETAARKAIQFVWRYENISRVLSYPFRSIPKNHQKIVRTVVKIWKLEWKVLRLNPLQYLGAVASFWPRPSDHVICPPILDLLSLL